VEKCKTSFPSITPFTYVILSEPGGSLDAKNVCGLGDRLSGGASDLDRVKRERGHSAVDFYNSKKANQKPTT
jgi:hypothetical protein